MRNARPSVRRRSLLSCGLFVGVVLTVLSPAKGSDLGATAQAAISSYRQQHGLSAVTVDARLTQIAREHAAAMARVGILDHNVGGSFASRIASYDPAVAAENIAAGFRDFSSVLSIWKRSSGHNANLLKPGVTRIGIASAPAPQSKYKVFWTLILARPDAPPAPQRKRQRQGPVIFLR